MARKYKITEEQYMELIDKDGSIISGNSVNTDNKVKTNQYRDYGTPETTDDFADATGQRSSWNRSYRGFSFSEGMVKEDINSKINNNTSIPDIIELTKSYNQNGIQSNLSELAKSLYRIAGKSEDIKDIKAIILKELLTIININSLHPRHIQEIKKLIGGNG